MKNDQGHLVIESPDDFTTWRIMGLRRHKAGVVKVDMQRTNRGVMERVTAFSGDEHLASMQLPGLADENPAPRKAAKKAAAKKKTYGDWGPRAGKGAK